MCMRERGATGFYDFHPLDNAHAERTKTSRRFSWWWEDGAVAKLYPDGARHRRET